MASIATIRKLYPELNDVPDNVILNAAKQTGFDLFTDRMLTAPEPEVVAEPKGRTLSSTLNDLGVTAKQAFLDIPQAGIGLLDIPAGGQVGKGIDSFLSNNGFNTFAEKQAELETQLSPEQQAANQAVQNAQGVGGTLSALWDNPSTLPLAALRSVPSMYAGGLLGKLGGLSSPLARGAVGEGLLTAGQNEEQIRQQTPDQLTTPEQGGLAALSGVGTGAISALSGGLANKIGASDFTQIIAGGKGGTGDLLRRTGGGIVTEGGEEGLQSAQEQMATNAALNQPLTQGVGNAAVFGAATGGLLGGFSGLVHNNRLPSTGDPLTDELNNAGAIPQPDSDPMSHTINEANSFNPSVVNVAPGNDLLNQTVTPQPEPVQPQAEAIPQALQDYINQQNSGYLTDTGALLANENRPDINTSGTSGIDAPSINENGGADTGIAATTEAAQPDLSAMGDFASVVQPEAQPIITGQPELSGAESSNIEPSQNTEPQPEFPSDLILRSNGSPFPDEKQANNAIKVRKALSNDTHEIVPVDGGFAIAPKVTNAETIPTQAQADTQQAKASVPSALDNGAKVKGKIPAGNTQTNTASIQDSAIPAAGYADLKQAKSALKKAGKDTHDIIQTGDSYTVVPTQSLSFEQFKSLPRNSGYSNNMLRQSYEAETGKQATESNNSQANFGNETAFVTKQINDNNQQYNVANVEPLSVASTNNISNQSNGSQTNLNEQQVKTATSLQEPWEMTRDEYLSHALDNNPYKDEYKKDADLLDGLNKRNTEEWRESILKQAEVSRIPDAVLDDYEKTFGKNSLSAFRGVKESGIEGYIPKAIRDEKVDAPRKLDVDEKPLHERTWKQQRELIKKSISRKLSLIEWREERSRHKDAIINALFDKKSVPQEALADYPDLQKQYASKSKSEAKPVPSNTRTNPQRDAQTVGAVESAAAVSSKAKTRKVVPHENDDLLAAIAKLGGISAREAKAQGIDPAAFSTRGHGIARVFHNGKAAKTYDEMAELLRGHNYDTPSANDLVDKVSRAINQGEKIYTPTGSENAAKIAYEERISDDMAEHVMRIEKLLETAKAHDAEFGTKWHAELNKIDDFTTEALQTWEQDLNDDREYRYQESNRNSQAQDSGEGELRQYTEKELRNRENAEKIRQKVEAEKEKKAAQLAADAASGYDVFDEMLGNIPGTNDLFGGNPMQQVERAEKPKTLKSQSPGIPPSLFNDLPRGTVANAQAISKDHGISPEQAKKVALIHNRFNDIVHDSTNENSPIPHGIGYYSQDKSDNPNGKVFVKC